ncbi:Nin one binding Zn-ribbon like-domain-containing protein [Ampelomyces quisqualis]|uniref:20S-pre-rRNA D-site endonuclease NOB1 n=1 Tax=Ampelomyces quisqualis TaxID=50730 RepID=A0A6A5QW12_AMPQU|nr:Nin one binding Zn-ribbon like-domain-containing protein [Ampelomyces quisqualis]
MATEAPQKPIHSLILDTGPLIKNAVPIATIINSAEEIFTTPAIISEIRDEATRSRVQTTLVPFLKIRNPSPASYDAVVAFSKKTGDFSVLSRQDLGVLALAYEVHCERNGGPWGLREAPKQPLKTRPDEKQLLEEDDDLNEGLQIDEADMSNEVPQAEEHAEVEDQKQADEAKVIKAEPAKEVKIKEQRPRKEKGSAKHKQMKEEREKRRQARAAGLESSERPPIEQQGECITADGIDGFMTPATAGQSSSIDIQSNFDDKSATPNLAGKEQEVPPAEVQREAQKDTGGVEIFETQKVEETVGEPAHTQPSTQAVDEPAPEDSELTQANEDLAQDLSTLNITTPPSPPATDDDDSDGDWITPSNLTKRQATDAGIPQDTSSAPQEQIDVATMTIDFAMQNVLLQMNLRLLSTNMQRIRTLSSKVLRCHACFLVVRDMSKQFCPRCGALTLRRVNCSTNTRGEFRLHLAKNYQWNKRGDKYSIPKPIAGTANTKWSGIGGGQGGWGRDLVLAEDQKEYTRRQEEEKRIKGARDLMDGDYLPGILTGDRSGRSGGRMKVGAGRNVNSKKRG